MRETEVVGRARLERYLSESGEEFRLGLVPIAKTATGHKTGSLSELRDELYGETVRIALEKFAEHDDARAFGPWLAGIARNVARRWHEREIQAKNRIAETPEGYDVSDHGRQHERMIDIIAARQILQTLGEPDRTIARRCLMERIAVIDVAAETGLTEGHVRVKCHRLRERLRRELLAAGKDAA